MDHTPAWLINSFIYLSAAVIAVPLSKALGLGAIIGYLASGMAIGPWGLGLVSHVQDILHFAEFGVVAVSMLVSPLLLVATDKWLLPRLARRRPTVQLEEIAKQQDAPVLIAGFGRYGQIVGRMMVAEVIAGTVLEHDAEMVEAARANSPTGTSCATAT